MDDQLKFEYECIKKEECFELIENVEFNHEQDNHSLNVKAEDNTGHRMNDQQVKLEHVLNIKEEECFELIENAQFNHDLNVKAEDNTGEFEVKQEIEEIQDTNMLCEDMLNENTHSSVDVIRPPHTFQVDRSIIPSVSKGQQATELQAIDGLSVYDQDKFEAGVLEQVDNALDSQKDVLEDEHIEPVPVLEGRAQSQNMQVETERERQIRLGEMTPFGTMLSTNRTSSSISTAKELTELEKYLQQQEELGRKRKMKPKSPTKKDPIKKTMLNRGGKKKHHRKKEYSNTETQDFAERKPDVEPETIVRIHLDSDPSGSEYVPSESDGYSSEDEETNIRSEKCSFPTRKKAIQRKSLYKLDGRTKIPEDWRSDDSDWEYSDEDDVLKKKRRSKKEMDDGDVDEYNHRLRLLEKTKNDSENEPQDVHEIEGGYKISNSLWNKLYNYQKVGVQWLWELDQQRCGGILGDEMGLGKTIQVIAFLAGLHTSQMKDKDTGYRGLGPSLIVCPTTVMHQWVREFHKWFPVLRVALLHESGTFNEKDKTKLIRNAHGTGGMIITSYTGAVQHKDALILRQWHYVILDEGHKIRNPDAQVTLVVKQLKTTHRIILSGSPMQNNLKELWSLFDFIFPGKLGTLPVFLTQFAVPITQGGYANASQVQVATAFKCATVLKDSIAPFLLRRMKADVQSHIKLPDKNEQVLFCRLTDEQRKYYKGYLDTPEVDRILQGRAQIFMGLINLRKICNHPDLFSGGVKLFHGETEESLRPEDRYGYWGKSGKMIVVETLLKIWKKQGHRVLIFTQSRQMLSILEEFIKKECYTYLKLDGATSIGGRQPIIDKFNQDTSYFAMLLTTRVGGLGVNLTGANRVLIYDPDWNPATDTQARERAWRIGQKQSVTIYRLITAGTIEEKMYHRQIFKQFLTNKVLKDPKQTRFFKSNDLFELFTLKESDVDGSTETGAIFAGTGSEVKLDPTKSYRFRKCVQPKSISKPLPVTFSKKKIEHMKKLAQQLSKKIATCENQSSNSNILVTDASQGESKEFLKSLDFISETNKSLILTNNYCDSSVTSVNSLVDNNRLEVNNECIEKLGVGSVASTSEQSVNVNCDSGSSLNMKTSENNKTSKTVATGELLKHKLSKKHKKKRLKKKRRVKDAIFEGETVSHLVRHDVSVSKENEGDSEENKNCATQDEYVLKKLFSKSGLQTALKHDTIMEGGPADYALVEGEAERVAKQAVEALKESRRDCWNAMSGMPTFTGQSGILRLKSKPRFGATKSDSDASSSSEILNRIRHRNLSPNLKDAETRLLNDIREFLSSQGGTATTALIVSTFEKRLPENSSPLFKSLLMQICTFYRAPDKIGYWTLKDDFNW